MATKPRSNNFFNSNFNSLCSPIHSYHVLAERINVSIYLYQLQLNSSSCALPGIDSNSVGSSKLICFQKLNLYGFHLFGSGPFTLVLSSRFKHWQS